MSIWTVGTLLDYVQELIGEDVGEFYNVTTRLNNFNRAQDTMVEEARALQSEVEIPLEIEELLYDVPDDFLTFHKIGVRWEDAAGHSHPITVIDEADVDDKYPNWQESGLYRRAIPQAAFLKNGQIHLLPAVGQVGTLIVPYVVQPDQLTDFDDVPFNGIGRFQKYAPGLAYHAANIIMLPRSLQYARTLHTMYRQEINNMRLAVRRTPQHEIFIRPKGYRRAHGVDIDDRIKRWRNR